MIRSDEAKTWRYRGKNVNQLKSLTLKAFSRPVLYTRGIMDQLSNDLCQTDGRTKVLTWPSCQVWLSLVCCPTNGHDTQTEGRLTLEKYILSFVIVSLPIFTLKDQFNILADKVLYFFFNICNTSSRMYLYLYIYINIQHQQDVLSCEHCIRTDKSYVFDLRNIFLRFCIAQVH